MKCDSYCTLTHALSGNEAPASQSNDVGHHQEQAHGSMYSPLITQHQPPFRKSMANANDYFNYPCTPDVGQHYLQPSHGCCHDLLTLTLTAVSVDIIATAKNKLQSTEAIAAFTLSINHFPPRQLSLPLKTRPRLPNQSLLSPSPMTTTRPLPAKEIVAIATTDTRN